ncbi:MAG: hypothetical protein AAGA09_00400 [Pseudomonadota bacterium]
MSQKRTSFIANAAGAVVLFASPGAVSAGQFETIADSADTGENGGGVYSFTDCKPPAGIETSENAGDGEAPASKPKGYNERLRAYNERVRLANEYLTCIAAEADRDLHMYYRAVSTTLDAEQSRVLDALEAERQNLPTR